MLNWTSRKPSLFDYNSIETPFVHRREQRVQQELKLPNYGTRTALPLMRDSLMPR